MNHPYYFSEQGEPDFYTIYLNPNGDIEILGVDDFEVGAIVEAQSAPGKRRIAQVIAKDEGPIPPVYIIRFICGGPEGEWPIPGSDITKVSPLKALSSVIDDHCTSSE